MRDRFVSGNVLAMPPRLRAPRGAQRGRLPYARKCYRTESAPAGRPAAASITGFSRKPSSPSEATMRRPSDPRRGRATSQFHKDQENKNDFFFQKNPVTKNFILIFLASHPIPLIPCRSSPSEHLLDTLKKSGPATFPVVRLLPHPPFWQRQCFRKTR